MPQTYLTIICRAASGFYQHVVLGSDLVDKNIVFLFLNYEPHILETFLIYQIQLSVHRGRMQK